MAGRVGGSVNEAGYSDSCGEASPLLTAEEAPMSSRTFAAATKIDEISTGSLLALVSLAILLGTANRVLYKVSLAPLRHYSEFLGFLVAFVYTTVYFSVLIYRVYLAKVTPTRQWTLPWSSKRVILLFATIGVCEGVGYVLGVLTAKDIDAELIPLLSQSTLPFTILLSTFMLKRKYSIAQMSAAALVIGGVITCLVGGSPAHHHPARVDGTEQTAGLLLKELIFSAASGLTALSSVVKEAIFVLYAGIAAKLPARLQSSYQERSLDVFVVTAFGSFAQLLATFASLPLLVLPAFGGRPFAEIGQTWINGFVCFSGHNPTEADNCYGAPLAPVLYMCVNLAWNITLIFLLKHGSALFMFIGVAACIPLAEIAFSYDLPLLGPSQMLPQYVIGAVLIMIGLAAYRYLSVLRERRGDRGAVLKWSDCI